MLIRHSSNGSGVQSPWQHHSLVLPPASSHLAWVISWKPCPLHSPWPLQAFLAVMQSFCPLQALTPKHFTSAVLASCAACAGRVVKRLAATRARAAPVAALDFFDIVGISLGGIGSGRVCARPWEAEASLPSTPFHKTRKASGRHGEDSTELPRRSTSK